MMWLELCGSIAMSFAMFLYGAFVSDELAVPNVCAFIHDPGIVNACSGAVRLAGFGAYASVHGPLVVEEEWYQTPNSVAAQTLPPPKRSLWIVEDSSSVPPTRVQLVFVVGLVSW